MSSSAVVLFNQQQKSVAFQAVEDEKKSTALDSFRNISTMINKSIGNVPPKAVPMLQHLTASYSVVNAKVKKGMAITSACMTKFLVKSAHIMAYGYDESKLLQLKSFVDKMNSDYLQDLDDFLNTSRDDLINIGVQLVGEAKGGVAEGLEQKRAKLEAELDSLLKQKGKLQIQIGEADGNIESATSRINFSKRIMADKAAAKAELAEEIKRLTSQIKDYEEEIFRRKNTTYQERGSFWFFSWRIRDVEVNNGERIARENLNRLLGRISECKTVLNNFNEANIQQDLENATRVIPAEQEKKLSLTAQIAEKDKAIEQTRKDFESVIAELAELYKGAGSANLEALKNVDALARGVEEGVNSLTDAYGVIMQEVLTIDHDPQMLLSSVKAGIHLLALSDEFMSGRALENVRTTFLQLKNE